MLLFNSSAQHAGIDHIPPRFASACRLPRFFLSFRVLFAIAVFVGSGLLFIAQPMIGKMLLPRVGGAPAVWTTSVLFFQVALLAGYGYAHWLSRRPRGIQIAIHAALLLLPLGLVPFRLVDGAPGSGPFAPTVWLFESLLLAIGAPFFVLSAGAPLLQKWLSGTSLPGSKDPYFLYAAANAGSLLALGAYPILVEPTLGLERQRALWAWGYGAYLILALACAARAWRARSEDAARGSPQAPDAPAPSPGRRWSWMALAAAPASLMLGVTSILTTDVAAGPFVWVLSLSLYLVTFVLAFARSALCPAGLPSRVLPLAAVILVLLLVTQATEPLAVVLPAHLGVLFVAALACHTELARLRPHPSHLTSYYSFIGVGGALGGAFNALAAPLLFEGFVEVPIAFVAACLLVPRASPVGGREGKKKEKEARRETIRRSDVAIPVALGLSTFLLAKVGDVLGASSQPRELLAAGIPAFLIYLASERRLRFGLSVGAVLWAGSLDTSLRGRPLLTDRSFFGIHRVTLTPSTEDGRPVAFHQLYHGTTLHGAQRAEADSGKPMDARRPLAYYAETSPIGRLFRPLFSPAPALAKRVGLVGLGAGSLLAYAEPGQQWSVFEIDREVQRIAEDGRYFSYLPEARARDVDVEVVLGDARLTLPSAAGSFDLLVLDAFSSGSIPVHLLTREAFELYMEKLTRDGILAFHISNRHLDLAPLMRAMATDLGLATALEDGAPSEASTQKLGSRWAFLARSSEALGARGFPSEALSSSASSVRVWTDDRSDLWSLFEW